MTRSLLVTTAVVVAIVATVANLAGGTHASSSVGMRVVVLGSYDSTHYTAVPATTALEARGIPYDYINVRDLPWGSVLPLEDASGMGKYYGIMMTNRALL